MAEGGFQGPGGGYGGGGFGGGGGKPNATTVEFNLDIKIKSIEKMLVPLMKQVGLCVFF